MSRFLVPNASQFSSSRPAFPAAYVADGFISRPRRGGGGGDGEVNRGSNETEGEENKRPYNKSNIDNLDNVVGEDHNNNSYKNNNIINGNNNNNNSNNNSGHHKQSLVEVPIEVLARRALRATNHPGEK